MLGLKFQTAKENRKGNRQEFKPSDLENGSQTYRNPYPSNNDFRMNGSSIDSKPRHRRSNADMVVGKSCLSHMARISDMLIDKNFGHG
jgi:hypothetical protein